MHPHLEAARPARHLLADPAEADQPERLVRELHAGEARTFPAALLERAVRLRDLAGERKQEARIVCSAAETTVDCGRVRDDDPALRRRREVDVVHPHPGPADHLQALGPLDQVGGELRPAADDDRVVVADRRGEVAVRVDVDVESLSQEVDARPPRSVLG